MRIWCKKNSTRYEIFFTTSNLQQLASMKYEQAIKIFLTLDLRKSDILCVCVCVIFCRDSLRYKWKKKTNWYYALNISSMNFCNAISSSRWNLSICSVFSWILVHYIATSLWILSIKHSKLFSYLFMMNTYNEKCTIVSSSRKIL